MPTSKDYFIGSCSRVQQRFLATRSGANETDRWPGEVRGEGMRRKTQVAMEGFEPPDTRIMIPLVDPINPGESDGFQNCAAPGAARILADGPHDPDLESVIRVWADLPDAIRAGITAMVRASEA
ncbi:hypothetical protein HG15A2_09230 [Adhaeretor mobilis]|uniref:Uncharacterized protein n=1 Tax=Adhaeretor mobilis TaxID=1930276 RepID=A0A517MS00_9BACT|nr:hypothetical protein HG15A2_09230 [Adhaeretor mobilis]